MKRIVVLLLAFAGALTVVGGSFEEVVSHDRDRISLLARAALSQGPITITQARSPLSEGGPNDFFSMGDYFWPDPTKPGGKPFVQRDGESYVGLFNEHRKAVMQLRDTTAALAAAYRMTGEEQYAAKAVSLLKIFFLDPATRMNPNLEYAQVIVGKATPTRGIGLIDTLHLIEVPMAIKALEQSPAMTPTIQAGLTTWFREYLTWFSTSAKGKNEAVHPNNHAVAYWLQVASYCQLAPDEALLKECRRQFKEVFVGAQMAPDGSFPNETRRTKPYAYSIFQLDNMATLCQLLSTQEENLWTFETKDGRCMRKAMAYLYPFLEDKSKWPLKPDVQAWEAWPVRQSSLLFAGEALGEKKYVELWKRLKPDPTLFEIRRNNAITQPLLWLKREGDAIPFRGSERGEVTATNEIVDGQWIVIGNSEKTGGSVIRDADHPYKGSPVYRFSAANESVNRIELSELFGSEERLKGVSASMIQRLVSIKATDVNVDLGQYGDTVTYEWSTRFPERMGPETLGIFAQWHGRPDRTLVDDGHTVRMFPLEEYEALTKTIEFKEDGWGYDRKTGTKTDYRHDAAAGGPIGEFRVGFNHVYLMVRSDASRCSSPEVKLKVRPTEAEGYHLQRGPKEASLVWKRALTEIPLNVWIDFKVRIHFSKYEPEADKVRTPGSVTLWMNGSQVADWHGNIGQNDSCGPYFKFGIYKPGPGGFKVDHAAYRRTVEANPSEKRVDDSSRGGAAELPLLDRVDRTEKHQDV